VQTPLFVSCKEQIEIGDLIFARPAKAGEIAERFLIYHAKKGNRIIGEMKTYRGYGQCFY